LEACEYFCPLSVVYYYNKYIFDFIDIYRFIQVSGCVGMGRAVVTALYSPREKQVTGVLHNHSQNIYCIGTSNKLCVKALNSMPYTTNLD
jgi:hypothetical protein